MLVLADEHCDHFDFGIDQSRPRKRRPANYGAVAKRPGMDGDWRQLLFD
jgi:hypothetical protein